jgi:hypothetical protein
MRYKLIADKFKVSCVGIGGHFGKMEEGEYEHRYTEIDPNEVRRRTALIERAVAGGVTYFDTTWRNEVDMLSQSIAPLGIRDKIYINGMVLGAFTGSKAMGMDVCDYFDKWMDERLRVLRRLDEIRGEMDREPGDAGQVLGALLGVAGRRIEAGADRRGAHVGFAEHVLDPLECLDLARERLGDER